MTFKQSCSIGIVAMAVAAAGVVFALPLKARTECPSFPKVSFWGEMTHQSVSKHVEGKLGGDWGAYLAQLQRQQKSLVRIQKRGAGVAIKRQGRKIKLAGVQLDKYVRFSKQRLAVIKCLVKKKETEKLTSFSTAAGTPESSTKSKNASSKKRRMQRTFITIPKDLLAKIRKRAVRQSLSEDRKKSVSDVVVEILEKEINKRKR